MARSIVLPFLLLAAYAAAGADTELVLQDGQVLRGVGVSRQAGIYVLQLESGGSLTIPAELVYELRQTDDGPSGNRAPSGLVESKPKTLAGDPVHAPRPAEQLEALGEPSRFRMGVIDPGWTPQSDWSNDPSQNNFNPARWYRAPIDPLWEPESAFDASIDVLAPSRSVWSDGIIDPTWRPTDGFRRRALWNTVRSRLPSSDADPSAWYERLDPEGAESGMRFRFPVSSSAAADRPVDPQSCAESFFGSAAGDRRPGPVRVRPVDDERYGNLPIALFEATGRLGDETHRAVFSMAGGECNLIGGDLRALLGEDLTDDRTDRPPDRGALFYETTLGGDAIARLETDREKIEYAYAVISLLDPDVTGARQANLVLLWRVDELLAIGREESAICLKTSGKRKRQVRQALKRFEPPDVVRDSEGDIVRLHTWSSAGGKMIRHAVRLGQDGKVAVHREPVATHVGIHAD